MSWFSLPTEWSFLAERLGLVPRVACAGYGSLASFRQLERSMGPSVGPPPSFSHWLHGQHGGAEVLVVHYETGAGSNRTPWTDAVARIDPPLLIGASIARQGRRSKLFGGEDVQLGVPHADAALLLGALLPEALQSLLRPQDARGHALLQALVSAAPHGLTVTDSTVAFTRTGRVTNLAQVAAALTNAAWIAGELSARRRSVPLSAPESALRREWQSYAESTRLAFDAERMTVRGEIEGAHVEVALETNGGKLQTAVGVRWPHSIGLGLRVTKNGTFGFLGELFGQDIKTGDAAFDETFQVQGRPEPSVRQALASPALRATLLGVAARSNEITLHDDGAFWLLPGATTRMAELEAHVQMCVVASRALFGSIQSQGPYR